MKINIQYNYKGYPNKDMRSTQNLIKLCLDKN